MKKYVVYTVNFGEYDFLRNCPEKSEEVDYICFTDDKNLCSKNWQIRYVEAISARSDLNRWYKFFPNLYLSEYDYSIYVDGNIAIKKDLINLFIKYQNITNIAVLDHRYRNCLYEEAYVCIAAGKGVKEKIQETICKYKSRGYPDQNGLYEMGVIFRKTMSPEIIALMTKWWQEFSVGAGRDQISFPYACWEHNVIPAVIDESPRISSEYFSIKFHRHENSLNKFRKLVLYCRINRNTNLLCKIIAKIADAKNKYI